MRSLCPIAVVAALAALPAPAALGTAAPGRVAYPLPGRATAENVQSFGVTAALAMPDGGMLTGGADGHGHVVLVRLRGDGSLEPAFGAGGRTTLTVPGSPITAPQPTAILPAPGGAIYVVTPGPVDTRDQPPLHVVSRVLPDGRLDPAFGAGGSVVAAIHAAWPAGAAVQQDGSVVLSGAKGFTQTPPGAETFAPDEHPTIERLTPAGARDPAFGGGDGVVELPQHTGGPVAVLPDGTLAVAVQTRARRAQLVELRSDGSIAPEFNAGRPLDLGAVDVGGLVARSDGAVDVLVNDRVAGAPPITRPVHVLRIRPDGSADRAFGTAGTVDLHGGELAATLATAPDGAEVVTAQDRLQRRLGAPYRLRVARLLPDGRPDPAWGGPDGRVLLLPFGGGYGTLITVHRQPVAGPLTQSGATSAVPVVRPDGGLLVAASVGVVQYTGEGAGLVHGEVGAAAFGPDLTADTAWGTPPTGATLALRFPRQTASGIARSKVHVLRVGVAASAAGLARIEVTIRGRAVARVVAPIFHAGRQRVLVPLTRYGRRAIARAGGAPIVVRGRLRDLVEATAAATVHARLR